MKKYLFLSVVAIAWACSSSGNRDETKKEEEKTCNCNSQLFTREQRIDKNGETISDTGWKETGNNTPYSKKCDDHNKVYGGSTSTTSYPGRIENNTSGRIQSKMLLGIDREYFQSFTVL